MANTVEYITNKGFNKNIFIEGDAADVTQYDTSKMGVEFFPGNEILVPRVEKDEPSSIKEE